MEEVGGHAVTHGAEAGEEYGGIWVGHIKRGRGWKKREKKMGEDGKGGFKSQEKLMCLARFRKLMMRNRTVSLFTLLPSCFPTSDVSDFLAAGETEDMGILVYTIFFHGLFACQ